MCSAATTYTILNTVNKSLNALEPSVTLTNGIACISKKLRKALKILEMQMVQSLKILTSALAYKCFFRYTFKIKQLSFNKQEQFYSFYFLINKYLWMSAKIHKLDIHVYILLKTLINYILKSMWWSSCIGMTWSTIYTALF